MLNLYGEGLVQPLGGPHLTLNHPFLGVASTKSSRSLRSLVLLLIGVAQTSLATPINNKTHLTVGFDLVGGE